MRELSVTTSSLARARRMEDCYSRDLLRGIGGGDAPQLEYGSRPPRVEMEEVELSLGLSLGGRFGLQRGAEKLVRSSSVAAILMPPEKVVARAPPTLARTSSLPVKAESGGMGVKQGLEGRGSCRENDGFGAVAVVRLPGSGSPSSASSDGEGQRLHDPLMRTTSLPAGFDDDSRKRKVAQSIKRHELKKRIERRNSLTCNILKEAAGQNPEVLSANANKLESPNEAVTRNKQNHSNDKHPMNGLPPMHQATFASRDCVSLAMQKKHNSAFKGMAGTEEHRPPSDVPLLCGRDQQNFTGRAATRAQSMGDAERIMMQEMPSVSTKGIPNGNKVEGFLHKYRKGDEVRIVCVCCGRFLTPAEFVKHAGGSDVANPLRHIVVNPTPQPFL